MVVITVAAPLAISVASPLLEWRDPTYQIAGFAGVFAMALLLIQPLLAGGYLPGLSALSGRRLHRWVGLALVAAVVLHVVGLWVTSPPDVIDALLFRSPTPFSIWGVIALFSLVAAALLAVLRQRLRRRLQLWRFAIPLWLASSRLAVCCTLFRFRAPWGTVSKVMLCMAALIATAWVIVDRGSWAWLGRRGE